MRPLNTSCLMSFLVAGWLAVLIGVLLWRGVCELMLAVFSIAEDLRTLRQYQEKLGPVPAPAPSAPAPQPQTFTPEPQAAAEPAPAPQPTVEGSNVMEDPFFNPRFGKRDY